MMISNSQWTQEMWKQSPSSKWLRSWHLHLKTKFSHFLSSITFSDSHLGILHLSTWHKFKRHHEKISNSNNILLLLLGRTIKSMVLGFRSTSLVHFTMPTPQGIKQWESKVKDNLSWKTKECLVRESLSWVSGLSNSKLTYFQRCIWLLLVHDIHHRDEDLVKQW